MNIAFNLTMPGRSSWNGQWSGEGQLYCVIRNVPNKRAAEILARRSYGYRWSDGWAARINVSQVDASAARRLRKKSQGFCGYDWMIDCIIRDGCIYVGEEERQQKLESMKEHAAS